MPPGPAVIDSRSNQRVPAEIWGRSCNRVDQWKSLEKYSLPFVAHILTSGRRSKGKSIPLCGGEQRIIVCWQESRGNALVPKFARGKRVRQTAVRVSRASMLITSRDRENERSLTSSRTMSKLAASRANSSSIFTNATNFASCLRFPNYRPFQPCPFLHSTEFADTFVLLGTTGRQVAVRIFSYKSLLRWQKMRMSRDISYKIQKLKSIR